jgi:hypothetical protein
MTSGPALPVEKRGGAVETGRGYVEKWAYAGFLLLALPTDLALHLIAFPSVCFTLALVG